MSTFEISEHKMLIFTQIRRHLTIKENAKIYINFEFLFVNEQSSSQKFYLKVKFFPKNIETAHIIYMKGLYVEF